MKISESLTLCIYFISFVKSSIDGISFVVVGDFANIADMTRSNLVFDGINQMKKDSQESTPEDF